MRLRLASLLALSALLLTGCVHYRLGVEFDWLGGGRVAQVLNVDESLMAAGGAQLNQLTHGLEQRTRALGGYTERKGNQILLVIPFHNPAELGEKVNLFLGQPLTSRQTTLPEATVPVRSRSRPFEIQSQDRWLWTEYRLGGDLDLRIPLAPGVPAGMMSALGMLRLEFALTTPLSATASNSNRQEGTTLLWEIFPGQLNHLEASFTLPNWPLLVLLALLAIGSATVLWRKSNRYESPYQVSDARNRG